MDFVGTGRQNNGIRFLLFNAVDTRLMVELDIDTQILQFSLIPRIELGNLRLEAVCTCLHNMTA